MEAKTICTAGEDTICAIATPPGMGGIGIVRVTGDNALQLLQALFHREPALSFAEHPRELLYGHIRDPERREDVDEVLAVYMPGPGTYTGEDVAEIDCHGGAVPLAEVMTLLMKSGCRHAEPGEFTKRAFLNGRMDLAQAEAVMDLVSAQTEEAGSVAVSQLKGRFSAEIQSLRAGLTDLLVQIEVNIDYPDEDIDILTDTGSLSAIRALREEIGKLLESARKGKILRDGLRLAIVGKPNVGKSSLLNGLLRQSRAIVTEIAGTTRDTIEEMVNIKGLPVTIVDTAGIRPTEDAIERIGIEKSKASLASADMVLLMTDVSLPLTGEDRDLRNHLPKVPCLIAFNKSDKGIHLSVEEREAFAGELPYVLISLRGSASKDETWTNSESVERIEDLIYRMATGSGGAQEERKGPSTGAPSPVAFPSARFPAASAAIVTNARHEAALRRADLALASALRAASRGEPPEILEIDLRTAYEELGFITGDSIQHDVLQEVFSRFCLGK